MSANSNGGITAEDEQRFNERTAAMLNHVVAGDAKTGNRIVQLADELSKLLPAGSHVGFVFVDYAAVIGTDGQRQVRGVRNLHIGRPVATFKESIVIPMVAK